MSSEGQPTSHEPGSGRREAMVVSEAVPGAVRRPPMIGPVLAVDLGGTRMRVAVVAPGGAVLARRVEPTPRQAACPDALLGLVAGMLDPALPGRAVIGVPGRVEYGT